MNPTRILAVSLLAVGLCPAHVSAQQAWSSLSNDMQIRMALQAAPQDLREGATVQGYNASGAFVTLREGSNDLICMAPNPRSAQLEVSCHHEGLEPFFARGRALTAEGITGQDRIMARWKEFEDGKLPIPFGAVNHILTATGFDASTGEMEGVYIRWTVYTPMATPATTGISASPAPGAPWLMFPGTPGSHIMITPPRGGGDA